MKVFFVLAALLAAVCALPVEKRIHGENGWYIPKVDGSSKWMSLAEGEEVWAGSEMETRVGGNTVSFYLYTSSNPTNGQKLTTRTANIQNSYFNSRVPTRFVIHGWGQSYTDEMNTEITAAWLSRGDFNVIVVDWSQARSLEYTTSVQGVAGTGGIVGSMILFLENNFGMSLDNLYVIGHSLGGQVAGFAGKTVGEGRIHTIIGLDPALPLFSFDNPSRRLSSADAQYVESIQTNGGKLGFLKPIGNGAFYPNGGQKQPGCGIDLTGLCSHRRSVTYYVEAVSQDNFGTIECNNYESAVDKNCGSQFSSVLMGADNNSDMVSGEFYVPVNSNAPYGITNY